MIRWLSLLSVMIPGWIVLAQPPVPPGRPFFGEPQPTPLPVGPNRPIQPQAPRPIGPARLDRAGDPMPPGAVARFGSVRLRHGVEPIALQFTHDGQHLLSVSATDDGIRLWDVKTGKESARLELPVMMGSLASDGQILVSDGLRCKVWSPALKTVRELPPETLPENTTILAVAPDCQSFAAGAPGKVVVCDLQSGQARGELKLPAELPPIKLVYSPDGRWLAGMGPNKSGVWLWDLKTRKRVRTYACPAELAEIAFNPSGDRIAILADSLRIYATDSEELLEGFQAVEEQLGSPRFSKDGKHLLAVRPDCSVVQFDAATGEEKESWPPPHDMYRSPTALAPGADCVAALDPTGGIRIWNPKTGDGPNPERFPPLLAPGFSADGKTITVHDERGMIRSFDAATGAPRATTDLKLGDAFPLAFDARSGRLAVAVGIDTFEVHVIDIRTGKVLARFPADAMNVPTVSFCPTDPDRLAIIQPGSVVIQSVKSDRPLRSFPVGQPDILPQGCYSPDGRLLALTTRPLSVWEVGTGKKRFEVEAILDPSGVVFSPDGRWLAVWDIGDVVVIFDTRTGTSVRRFQLPSADGSINVGIFTPDGKRFVTGSRDGLVTFWDTTTGEPVLNLDRHDGVITGLSFSPEGTRLVSTATDGTALVWDLTTRTERRDAAAAVGPDEALRLLGDEDATQAQRALAYLYARPAETVKLLRDRIPVPVATSPAVITRLIAELGHDDFQRRRAAVARLIEIGGEAEPQLRDAVKNAPQAEVRKLAEEVLTKIDAPPTRPDELRALRAVEVLEHLARERADARDVLRKWAAGPAGHRLTVEANAALERLK